MPKVSAAALKWIVAVALVIAIPAPTQAAELDERLADSQTHWINQGGSTMTLIFTPSSVQPSVYSLSGTYVNNVSGFRCQGTPYPLTGVYYVNTQTFSWSVAWSNAYEDCASVTGWTGYLTASSTALQINTNWNLAYSTGGSSRAIEQGQDTFTQQATVSSGSLLKEKGMD